MDVPFQVTDLGQAHRGEPFNIKSGAGSKGFYRLDGWGRFNALFAIQCQVTVARVRSRPEPVHHYPCLGADRPIDTAQPLDS